MRTRLGVDIGNTRLYQKPYDASFDSVSFPYGWRMPNFIKFSGEDGRTTWEHISQYIAQLGEAGNWPAIRVRLFSLSLTGTAFAWFSSLAPGSIRNWEQLERKFYDHFYSGSYEMKLTDLASVRQGRDESVIDYVRRFKDIKNSCFSLTISETGLADLCFRGLQSSMGEKIGGYEYYSVSQLANKAIMTEYNMNKEKENFKSIIIRIVRPIVIMMFI
jgi:hypothetical protein